MTQGQAAAAQKAAFRQQQSPKFQEIADAPKLAASWQERAKVWAKTGIVSVRDSGLQELPTETLTLVAPVRVLDASNNRLEQLPESLAGISRDLRRLAASHNQLSHSCLPGLACLTSLRVLLLDHNRLQHVPPDLTSMRALEHLSLANNQLEDVDGSCLPALAQLQRLELQSNTLTSLPAECDKLTSLQELNASRNRLQSLPASMGSLSGLRTLLLDTNRIRAVPREILTGCSSLAQLSLHDNPLTADQLREAEGFGAMDARRQLRVGKQLDMRVMPALDGFNEGADSQNT
ncbi:hypothetical protein WJX84_000823 [Apatococcus fuscideae]|uniref:Uncharacterized protein n=1 Tax=Apatococcus fuscideae TaxID=2026836 RepID=A0AAW1T9X6_9CHLO